MERSIGCSKVTYTHWHSFVGKSLKDEKKNKNFPTWAPQFGLDFKF